MKEIEIKIKVNDLRPLKKKLMELGCVLSEPIIQKDIIFNKKDEDAQKRNILRIRNSGEVILFTLKRNVTDELDCIEKEIKIDSSQVMEEIVNLLGFSEDVRVNKIRVKTKYRDYEICLDEVEGLGTFIELEKFSEEEAQKVRGQMCDFLESLGVDLSGLVLKGYDTLILEKNK